MLRKGLDVDRYVLPAIYMVLGFGISMIIAVAVVAAGLSECVIQGIEESICVCACSVCIWQILC